MKRILYKVLRYAPATILMIVTGILAVNICITIRKPQYGRSENPSDIALTTYLAGDNQPTHPSVYDFGKQWHGWRYWMAYSPYPNGNGEEENPCIAVSNDLSTWTSPPGLHNPIAFNEETGCEELKDPHIVYNSTTDSLEVWYLGRIDSSLASGGDLTLMYKSSADGINWSHYNVAGTDNTTLSPSIIYADGRYKRWAIKPSGPNKNGSLLYSESIDKINWTTPTPCIFNGSTSIPQIWHGAVASDSIYRFVFVESGSQGKSIFYTESHDGQNWSQPKEIIQKGTARLAFYRPCIIAANDSLYCFYGTIAQDNSWHIAMSSGKNPDSLHIHTHLYNCGDTISYYKSGFTQILNLIHTKIFYIIAVLTTIILAILPIQRFNIIWLINWVIFLLSVNLKYYHNTFMVCTLMLITGLMSIYTTLAILGLKTLIRNFRHINTQKKMIPHHDHI